MCRSILLFAVFSIQVTSASPLSTYALREKLKEAELNVTNTEKVLQDLKTELPLKEKNALNFSQIFEEKNATWNRLRDEADTLNKPRVEAQNVVDEHERLVEAWNSANKLYLKASSDFETAKQALSSTRDISKAANVTAWYKELAAASKADAAALERVQQHAAAKREADALLAVTASPEVIASDEAARQAELEKNRAEEDKKRAQRELDELREDIANAEKDYNEAKSLMESLKAELEERGDDGISAGSVAGLTVGVLLIIVAIIGGAVAYQFRDKLMKRNVKQIDKEEEIPLDSPIAHARVEGAASHTPSNKLLKSEEEEICPNTSSVHLSFQVTHKLESDNEETTRTDSGYAKKQRNSLLNAAQYHENNLVARSGEGSADELERTFPPRFYNEFVVKEIRGSGAYGCVFAVRNIFDDSSYAVKRVPFDAKDKEKALSEVRALAKLRDEVDHPGIVRYNTAWIENPEYGWQRAKDEEFLSTVISCNTRRKVWMDYNDDSLFMYIQMQLCKFSLSDWLKTHQDRTERERLRPRMKLWFKQIVSAVAYIHKKKIIHRDLKPSNMLYLDTDIIKICDLGISTERLSEDQENSDITRTSTGTRLYMSPEQRDFHAKYGASTDVFSLGLIMIELFHTMDEKERWEIFETYRGGKEFELSSEPLMRKFIRMVTQKEPKNRPTCEEMLDHPFLKDE